MSIFYNKGISEDDYINYVKNNAYNIQFIKNPSEAVQLQAVMKNDLAIKHIDNQFESVKLFCANNIFCMPYIKDPSEEVQLKAIRNCKFYNEERYAENLDYIVKYHITSIKAKELYKKMVKVKNVIK